MERPWGADAGQPGSRNHLTISRKGVTLRTARTPHEALARGDRVAIVTGGGGGWGDPADRSDEEIAADIADGLLSETQAREVYGR